VGKTALAVHLAGLLGDRYPDAHLFVDLHGHSDGSPLGVADALLILLRQLGVEADRIPADLAERLTLWRSRLAERRILIVFDNAASSAQVDPMLPPGAGHLAVVTTRRRLSGLDGVRTESIEVLDEERAVALLARIVGDRVPAEPEAAARLVKRCGGLPLAIRLAGARLAHRPRWQVADLVRRLDGAGLPALAAEERSVAGVFALSYGQLPAAEQRAFTLLGVHPDPRFDAASLAALTDVSLSAAERVAETFVELHLIEEPEPGLYRLHDLMREYAALLAAGDPAGSHAAIGRVTTHYRDVLTAFADGTQNRFATDPFDRPELVEAAGDLLTWADTHRPGFGPVIAASRAAGDPYAGWRLAYATFRFCFTQGYISDLIALQTEGLAAARESGDPAAIAESLFLLAPGQMLLGRLRKAIDLMTEALALNLAERNEKLVDRVRTNLSGLLGMVGRHAEEWEMAASAAEGWWRTHEGHGWLALSNAAESAMYRGEYADALRCQQMVWAIARYVGHPVAPAVAVAQLGEIRLRMGQPRLAATLLRGGMQRKAESNYRIGLVGDVTRLAVAHRELGDLPAAIELHERALREMAELNEMRWESVVCSDYAGTKLAAGDRVGALELYRRALPPAERSELAYEQARALNGIGRCLGEPAYEERGAEILTRTGAVESGPDQLRSPGGGSRMEG
jgi:tetratricopeptide (TPR) repeat protein